TGRAPVEVDDVATLGVAGLVAIDADVCAVRQKPGSTVLDMLEPLHGYRARLPCAQRQQLQALRISREDGNGPLAVRGKSARTAIAETDGRRTIQLPNCYGIVRSGCFAGILKQHPLPVARNVFR